jgi:DNA-binding response OmpR family regulator
LRTKIFSSFLGVIVLSGSEHENDRVRASELGATAYWVKPASVGDLQRFLGDLCPSTSDGGARA